jgi:hypothetical protein
VVAALGILLSKFSTFLTPALGQQGYQLHLASLTLTLFPVLLAAIAVFVCVPAVRLLPWTGAASMVVIVFLFVFLLVSAFVPPMMTLLVQAEHQTYLARASRIGSTIIPLLGQTPVLLLAALSIDSMVWLGRRGKWTLKTVKTRVLVAAMVSMVLVTGFILAQSALSVRAAAGGGMRGALVLGLALSLLLTVPGSLLVKLAWYNDPITAGDALPFALAVGPRPQGTLTYQVTASPGPGVPGSLSQGDVSAQQSTPYGVPGSITLVTRGSWMLHIVITGPAGRGEAAIPLAAVAPPAMPTWLAWNIGLLPAYGLLLFWVVQTRRTTKQRPGDEQAKPLVVAEMTKEVS